MTNDDALPALYEHCVRAYKAMLAESHAIVAPIEQSTKAAGDDVRYYESEQVIVYEGFLTQLILNKLNLSVPYYTSVRKALIQMGCVKQLKRGGSSSPSQWEMIVEPSEERFRAQQPTRIPKQDKYSALENQVRGLATQVSDLQDTINELVAAWAAHYGAKEVQGD